MLSVWFDPIPTKRSFTLLHLGRRTISLPLKISDKPEIPPK